MTDKTDSKERAGRFTKKPVTIDAWLIDFGNKPLPDWVNEAFRTEAIDWCPAGEGLYINTLEGHMLGTNGSWLIKGVQGELYACKPDIFAATYERTSLAASAGSEPVARVNDDGFIVEIGDLPIAPGQKLYLQPSPPEGMVGGWMPIETAPKDGTTVLVSPPTWPGRACSTAHYNADRFAKKPRPFWERDDALRSISISRETPPTHWMPLPEAPNA